MRGEERVGGDVLSELNAAERKILSYLAIKLIMPLMAEFTPCIYISGDLGLYFGIYMMIEHRDGDPSKPKYHFPK